MLKQILRNVCTILIICFYVNELLTQEYYVHRYFTFKTTEPTIFVFGEQIQCGK